MDKAMSEHLLVCGKVMKEALDSIFVIAITPNRAILKNRRVIAVDASHEINEVEEERKA
jgi:hypothetical protein